MGVASSVGGRGGVWEEQGVGNGSRGAEQQVGRKEIAPQTPTTTLPQTSEMHIHKIAYDESPYEHRQGYGERAIPMMILWTHGGMSVAIAGSWDNWNVKNPLYRSGKDFVTVKVLLPGFYQYQFIVDGEWRYAPDFPWMFDEVGNAVNILELKDYIPDNLASIEDFEPPPSPDSSYSYDLEFPEDYSKEPPPVPLHLTIQPYLENDESTFSKPPHVELNHLYFKKPKCGQHVVAVGETHRFQSKYVTAVLYKSLQGL